MFQLARQTQRRHDSTHRNAEPAVDRSPAMTPGKRALTDAANAGYLGAPDFYTRAVESAARELDALRSTALPNFVAIRRKRDLAPLTKQVELAKAAMQVRHMILSANAHVFALEKAATHANPMIQWLRQRMDRVVTRATKLGVYDNAMDMRPRRFVDDSAPMPAGSVQRPTNRVKTPTPHENQFAAAQPASVTRGSAGSPKLGNTAPAARLARGTTPPASAPATRTVRPVAPAPVRTPIQRKSTGTGGTVHPSPQAVAARGVESASAALPFASTIQRAFGRHDISSIRVQIGGAAAKASQKLGAKAYATGNLIAFEHEPDLHTAAHEAAHVIQQRRGVSLAGGIDDGTSDSYERHADEVADAVVAGRSVEHMFEDVGPTSDAPPVVQRKAGPDASYSFTHSTKARAFHSPALKRIGATAEWKAQWQFALKNGGSMGKKVTPGLIENDLRAGTAGAGIERSEGKFVAKLEAELLRNSTKFLDGELFSVASPITVSVESKMLSAALATDKLDFKLATFTVSLDGDFSKWWGFPDYIEVKGTVQLEVSVGPDLAAQVTRLAQAGSELEKAAKFEAKLAKTKQKLERLRAFCKHGDTCNVTGEIRDLERELKKLNGMRGRIATMRDGAIRRIRVIGKKLDSKVGGKLLKKIGARALSSVFKKFIPIYNLVSAAQDIYDVVEFLAGVNWAAFFDSDRGPGTTLGNGKDGEAGAGNDNEANESAEPLTDEYLGDAATYEGFLDARDNIKLSPAAETVMAALATSTATNGADVLTGDEKRAINAIVPEDLSSAELKQIAQVIAAAGHEPRDRVEVIAAAVAGVVQSRVRQDAVQPAPVQQHRRAPKAGKKKASTPKVRSKTTAPDRKPLDLRAILLPLVSFDSSGRVSMPPRIEMAGFSATVVNAKRAYRPDGDSLTYMVRVTLMPTHVEPGSVRYGGTVIVQGQQVEVVLDGIDARNAP